MERGWYRIKEAAQYASVSEKTLRGWLQEGLKHSRIKGTILIKSAWVDEFLEQFEITGRADAMAEALVRQLRR